MYSRFTIALKYLSYWIAASNGKGHGIHSPFVFSFIEKVLNDHSTKDYYAAIESVRGELLKNKRKIEVVDLGAGSSRVKSSQKRIDILAKTSLKSPKMAQLLNRMAVYFQSKEMIELGTSLGITTAYLAYANSESRVYTFEGDPSIAAMARNTFDSLRISNIELLEGNIDNTLPEFLQKQNLFDFVFIDGNHKKAPSLSYFIQILPHLHSESVVILDDIHWSEEMEQAWLEIKNHPSVTLSIDLFFLGIVFFKRDFIVKQHFTIRF